MIYLGEVKLLGIMGIISLREVIEPIIGWWFLLLIILKR